MTPDSPKRFPITVPDLGTGDDIIRISAWLVDVGQSLISGDRVVEVLAPGITFDIAAVQTGQLLQIVKPVDATVTAGEVVGWIET